MDKKTYEETVNRLKAVNKVVAGLAPEIQADGWKILKPYITAEIGEGGPNDDGEDGVGPDGGRPSGPVDVSALIEEHASDDDAADNALLVAAILYKTYGHGPYVPKDFTAIGEAHHLLMPRMGNFLPRTKREDKKVFRNTKEGWVITTHGGKWLATTYKVKRGTQTKPE